MIVSSFERRASREIKKRVSRAWASRDIPQIESLFVGFNHRNKFENIHQNFFQRS